MREHKDDFLPFLASVDGEDMPGATDDGIMTDGQFNEYCHRVEGTAEWGGEPEVSLPLVARQLRRGHEAPAQDTGTRCWTRDARCSAADARSKRSRAHSTSRFTCSSAARPPSCRTAAQTTRLAARRTPRRVLRWATAWCASRTTAGCMVWAK